MQNAFVIGRGMIGSSFQSLGFSRSSVIFASGVSNSKEERPEEFMREKRLLLQTIDSHPHADFVYFSTTSLENGVTSRYVEHKYQMELLVGKLAPRHYIFRLPQVVGLTTNNTLVNYLTRAMLRGDLINLNVRAVRNLLDVTDLVRLVKALVDDEAGLRECNILASASNVSVARIAERIAQISGLPARFNLIDTGDDQSIRVEFLKSRLAPSDRIFSPVYWESVLDENVPRIIAAARR